MCQKKLNFHLFQYNIKTIKDIIKIKKHCHKKVDKKYFIGEKKLLLLKNISSVGCVMVTQKNDDNVYF